MFRYYWFVCLCKACVSAVFLYSDVVVSLMCLPCSCILTWSQAICVYCVLVFWRGWSLTCLLCSCIPTWLQVLCVCCVLVFWRGCRPYMSAVFLYSDVVAGLMCLLCSCILTWLQALFVYSVLLFWREKTQYGIQHMAKVWNQDTDMILFLRS